jgi:4,4'-diaponeurosporenoate glycosyltransferase
VGDHNSVDPLQRNVGTSERSLKVAERFLAGKAGVHDGEAAVIFHGVAVHVTEARNLDRELHPTNTGSDLDNLGACGFLLLTKGHRADSSCQAANADHWRSVKAVVPLVVFAVGWLLALASLARLLPHRWASNRYRFDATGQESVIGAVSVIIPARNEENNIGGVVESVRAESISNRQIIVVDDHSTDGTAARAAAADATVISAPPLPDGWAGKCWACHTGQTHATAATLVFIDADVRIAPGALAVLASRVADDTIVSVQPWHDAGPGFEQLSVIPNLVALMGAGAFSVVGRPARLAFGPVLAMTRPGYDRSGGFETVRAEAVEDVALAHRFPRRVLLTGRHLASFRMHDTPRQFVDGWTRVLRSGVRNGSVLGSIAAAMWIGALIAGFTSPWLYIANVIGLGVTSRVAGRFRPPVAVLYPLALAAFVALCLRSLFSRQVQWRGRRLPLASPRARRRARGSSEVR